MRLNKLHSTALLVSLALTAVFFQNCSQFRSPHLSSTAQSSTQPMSEQQVQGRALYTSNCAACHGAVDVSSKLGRTASQIFAAMGSIPQMMSTPAVAGLSIIEVEAIAAALAPPTSTGPTTGPIVKAPPGACLPTMVRGVAKEGVRRLSRRELISSVLAVWPNAGFLDEIFQGYPESDFVEEVEKYDPQFNKQQVLQWMLVVDAIAESVTDVQRQQQIGGSCFTANPISNACWRDFFQNYGRKVLRRPLTGTEVKDFTAMVESTASAADGRRLAIHLLFRSPDFIFHFEVGVANDADRVRLSDFEVANRIAYALTGAPPDPTLATAADQGQLKTLTQIDAQARRILATAEARKKINSFYQEWLRYSAFKTPRWETFEWIAGLGGAGGFENITRQEVADFVDYITWRKKGSFQSLMTDPISFPRYQGLDYANGSKPWSPLNGVYGNDVYSNFTAEGVSEAAPYPAPNHPGVLTKAAFTMTNRLATDPIGRGVFLMRRILCAPLPSPDFSVINARLEEVGDLDPLKFSNVEIVSKKTAAVSCQACHSKINPLGFSLEQFSPIGKLQPREEVIDMKEFYSPNRAIVATHPLSFPVANVDLGDKVVSISSSADLVNAIANSKSAQQCMASYVIRNFDRRKENIDDSCALAEVTQTIAQGKPLIDVFVKSVANEDIFWRKK